MRVGTLAWEAAGGPPLSLGQRVATLVGAAGVVLAHVFGRFGRAPERIELAQWQPPDSAVARAAEEQMRELCSAQMCAHSLRTYWFSAIVAAQSAARVDREQLYVAAVMHDVGLFVHDRPEHERCFSVTGARHARALLDTHGWDRERSDAVALAITSNLEARVPVAVYGDVAHWLRRGGIVEVLAQGWKVHPDNLREILARYPRDGFADDAIVHVRREIVRNPGCRFACLDPLFPWLLRRSRFARVDSA